MSSRHPLLQTIALVALAVLAAALLAVTVVFFQRAEADRAAVLRELRDARQPRYEYKALVVDSEGHDRNGDQAMRFASVTPADDELTALGSAGWELVASYLEMETAFPNFGDGKYVTGLQPNVRPQRAVLVFRRRVA